MDMASAFESALRAKGISRRQRAELPFESKIDILIRMQKLTARIRKVSGRKPAGKAWPVESEKEKKKALSPKTKPGRVALAVSPRRNRRSRKQE
jgi:hypothetical protein